MRVCQVVYQYAKYLYFCTTAVPTVTTFFATTTRIHNWCYTAQHHRMPHNIYIVLDRWVIIALFIRVNLLSPAFASIPFTNGRMRTAWRESRPCRLEERLNVSKTGSMRSIHSTTIRLAYDSPVRSRFAQSLLVRKKLSQTNQTFYIHVYSAYA